MRWREVASYYSIAAVARPENSRWAVGARRIKNRKIILFAIAYARFHLTVFCICSSQGGFEKRSDG